MFRYPLELKIGSFEVPGWGQAGNSTEYTGHTATGQNSTKRKAPKQSAAHKLNEIIAHTLGNNNVSDAEKFKGLLETLNAWINLDVSKHSLREKSQAIQDSILNPENLKKIVANSRFAIQMQGSLLETNLTNLQGRIKKALEDAPNNHKGAEGLPISEFLMERGVSGAEASSLSTILKTVPTQAEGKSSFSKAEQRILVSKIIDKALSEASGESRESGAYSKAFNRALVTGLKEHTGKFDKTFLKEIIEELEGNAGLIGTVSMLGKSSHGESLSETIAGGTNNSEQNKTNTFANLEAREKAWSEAKNELTNDLSDPNAKAAAIKKVIAEGDKFLEGLHGMVAAGTIDPKTDAGLKQINELVNGLENKHVKAYVELATTKAVEANEVKSTSNGILEKYGLNMDQIIGKGVAAVALLAIFKAIFSGGGSQMLLRDGINPGSGLLKKGMGLIFISGILQHTGVLGETTGGGNKLLEQLAA